MSNLPKPNDPLVLGFDQVYENQDLTMTGHVTADEYSERSPIVPFDKFRPAREVGINDLPADDPDDQMQSSIVVALRMVGLSFEDIADMCKVSVSAIQNIVDKPATRLTFNTIVRNLINANAQTTQGRISSYANRAADRIFTLMDDEKAPHIVQLKAAQDVLDRSGTSPDQFFASDRQGSSGEDELKIVMMDEEDKSRGISVSMKRR